MRTSGANEAQSNPTWRQALAFLPALLCAFAGVMVILAVMNRGFDWTDEGFVYSMTASNFSGPGNFFGFQFLAHPFFGLVGETIAWHEGPAAGGFSSPSRSSSWLSPATILQATGRRLGRWAWAMVLVAAQAGTLNAWGYPLATSATTNSRHGSAGCPAPCCF